jgi:putative transposase
MTFAYPDTRELPKLGLAVHPTTVSRILQECGICTKNIQNYRPTTTRRAHAPSRDLLARDFNADGPYKQWLCEITYIPTDEGFLYLAGVMDA